MNLALEATDRGGSIALGREGDLLDLVYENSRTTHSERLMPAVERLFDKQDKSLESLDRIAVARGPGSFTAIRLAVTTAKTLAMVCEAELLAPSTLRAMAEYVRGETGTVTSVIDARRGEIYWQTFSVSTAGIKPNSDPQLTEPDELSDTGDRYVFRGRDLDVADVFASDDKWVLPEAATRPLAVPLLMIGDREQPVGNIDTVSPFYLRKSDAQRNSNGDDTA